MKCLHDRWQSRSAGSYLAELALAGIIAISGCGSTPTPPAPAVPATVAAKPAPPAVDLTPAAQVKSDDFPSVEAAFVEIERVLAMPESEEQKQAMIRCQNWIVAQREQAVPIATAHAVEATYSLPMRLTACRILGFLGPAATDSLLMLIDSSDSKPLRRQAVATLGRQKPASPAMIAKFIALLDDADPQIQVQAANAIAPLGEAAKDAAAKLSTLRREHPDEAVRVAAGQALKKVDPRKTFND